MPKPLGIVILAILILIAAFVLGLIGLAGIIVGLAFLLPGSGQNAGPLLLAGFIALLIAIVLGVSGMGLLALRPWAWWLALIVTVGAFIYTVYGIYQTWSGSGAVQIVPLLTAGFLAVLIGYLVSVYRRFRHPTWV